MASSPRPPPPRRDVPRPKNMTEEKYAAYLDYLAGSPPDVWRNTDGTIYPNWVPSNRMQYRGTRDLKNGVRPGDPDYGWFLDDLLPHFDYQGRKLPHAASTDRHAEA